MAQHEINDSPLIPARVRDWLYPVALAVVALLGGYGLLDDQSIPLWSALIVALLGVGTATAYRPARSVEPLRREITSAPKPVQPYPGWSPDDLPPEADGGLAPGRYED